MSISPCKGHLCFFVRLYFFPIPLLAVEDKLTPRCPVVFFVSGEGKDVFLAENWSNPSVSNENLRDLT